MRQREEPEDALCFLVEAKGRQVEAFAVVFERVVEREGLEEVAAVEERAELATGAHVSRASSIAASSAMRLA